MESMGGLLGALAGGGMLLLIGALIVRFLLEMGWMRRETGRTLLRVTGMTGGAGAVYLLAAFLIRRTLFGAPDSPAQVDQVFVGPYEQAMFAALEQLPPRGGPGALFAFLGHALGALLFGQYRLGGMALAFLLTDAGAWLLCTRLCGRWGREYAERAVFGLLCLPGAVFLFLPGWASALLFLAALSFFLIDPHLPRDRFLSAPSAALSPPLYDGLLCLCALLSAVVVACAVQGWIG